MAERALRTKVASEEFYATLDPGIRFAVRVLHANGIETCQSCEGGPGHSYDGPTVDLLPDGGSRTGFAALHYLEEYGLEVADIALLWRIDRGLPVENVWRLVLRRAVPERADEMLMFVRDHYYREAIDRAWTAFEARFPEWKEWRDRLGDRPA